MSATAGIAEPAALPFRGHVQPCLPTSGTSTWTRRRGNEAGSDQTARPGHRKNLIFGDNSSSSLPRQHSECPRDPDQSAKLVAQIAAREIMAPTQAHPHAAIAKL